MVLEDGISHMMARRKGKTKINSPKDLDSVRKRVKNGRERAATRTCDVLFGFWGERLKVIYCLF